MHYESGVNLFAGSSYRLIAHQTTAANFEQEVLQSQQAICLVYYIDNANCRVYLQNAEEEVNGLNGGDSGKEWLKLCTINADENRNLASAFSVERAKLPATYFIMQGTIIDKLVGHVKAARLSGILHKFMEHYQKELNVDLLGARAKDRPEAPLASAAPSDLVSTASTSHIIRSLTASLSGADQIRLPEESSKMDGLRKTIQEAKRKAHSELSELQRSIGMDLKQLPDSVLQSQYYKTNQFVAMASLSCLEALYLARAYDAIGDVSRKNVTWARASIQADFEPALATPSIRRLMSLIDAILVKGDLHLSRASVELLLNRGDSLDAELTSVSQHYMAFSERVRTGIEEHIDSRDVQAAGSFPTAFVSALFEDFKTLKPHRKLAKDGSSYSGPWVAPQAGEELCTDTAIQRISDDVRWQCKTTLIAVLQLYASDPQSQDWRSRLASLLF